MEKDKKLEGVEPVPYFLHEEIVCRLERNCRRMFILCIIIFAALIFTNAGWIWYESQFEDIVMTQEATTDDGGDAMINGTASGDIIYGEGEADD